MLTMISESSYTYSNNSISITVICRARLQTVLMFLSSFRYEYNNILVQLSIIIVFVEDCNRYKAEIFRVY